MSSEMHQNEVHQRRESRVLMEETHIRRRWQLYFHKLLSEDGDMNIVLGDLEHSKSRRDFRFCRRIRVEEVEGAIRWMSWVRATGLDKILVEF